MSVGKKLQWLHEPHVKALRAYNIASYLLSGFEQVFSLLWRTKLLTPWTIPLMLWTNSWRYPANIYLFKVSNRNTRKKCEKCSKLTIKWSDRRLWCPSRVFIVLLIWTYFITFSSVSIVELEQVNVSWVVAEHIADFEGVCTEYIQIPSLMRNLFQFDTKTSVMSFSDVIFDNFPQILHYVLRINLS